MDFKRAISFLLALIILVLLYSCETTNSDFVDSLPNIYTLKTTVEPDSAGTVNPSGGTFSRGETVFIEALPGDGFVFDQWGGDLTGSENFITLTFTQDRTITAYFIEQTYDLTIEIVGEGRVSEELVKTKSNDAILSDQKLDSFVLDKPKNQNPKDVSLKGLVDSSSQTQIVAKNIVNNQDHRIQSTTSGANDEVTVRLTAEPDSGWVFDRWEGDLAGNENPEEITLSSDQSGNIIAVFLSGDGNNISKVSGDDQTADVGSALDQPFFVKVEDQFGNPVSGFNVEFEITEIPSGAAGQSLSSETFSSNSSGEANTVLTLGSTPGIYVVEARAGTAEAVEFTASAEPGKISATRSTITVNPSRLSVGEISTVVVELRDSFDNAITGVSDFSINVSGEATVEEGIIETENQGTYQFGITNSEIERVTLEVRANSVTLENQPSIIFTSGNVSFITIDQIESPQEVGAEFPVRMTAKDQSGNVVTGYNGTASLNITIGDISPSEVNFSEGVLTVDVTAEEAGEEQVITVADSEDSSIRGESNTFQTIYPLFFLDENGVTIRCPDALPGETGVVDGIVYEAVDRGLLMKYRNERSDLSRVCTTPVNNMRKMFENRESFNQDISGWDLSNVTDMEKMFEEASSFNVNIGNWKVSNVTDMSEMFSEASSFNQDLGGWDVSNVTDMDKMFDEASSFNQDLRNWCVRKIDKEPRDFAEDSPLNPEFYPIWGNCP